MTMKMAIKTISELISADVPRMSDLFKISQQIGTDNNAYASRKITYGHILSAAQASIIDAVRNEWQLSSLSVRDIDSKVKTLESAISIDVEPSGNNVAKFAVSPKSLGHAHKDDDITNRADVIDLVQDFSEFSTGVLS